MALRLALLVRPAEDGADLPLTGSGHWQPARARPGACIQAALGTLFPKFEAAGIEKLMFRSMQRAQQPKPAVDGELELEWSKVPAVFHSTGSLPVRTGICEAPSESEAPAACQGASARSALGPVVYAGPGDSTQPSGWAFSDRVRNRGGDSRRFLSVSLRASGG